MPTATATAPAVAAMAATGGDTLATLRAAAAAIVARGGAPTGEAKEEYAGLMARWAAAGGPKDDAVVAVGAAVYGVEAAAAEPAGGAKAAAAPAVAYARVDFDFLETFMKDVFVQYGVPDDEAVTAAKVRWRRSSLGRTGVGGVGWGWGLLLLADCGMAGLLVAWVVCGLRSTCLLCQRRRLGCVVRDPGEQRLTGGQPAVHSLELARLFLFLAFYPLLCWLAGIPLPPSSGAHRVGQARD